MRDRSRAALLCLTGLAFLGPVARGDLKDVKQRGTLRVLAVFPGGQDEFFSRASPDAPGFDRELLEGFARLQRVKLEVVPIAAWDALIPALKDGKGDLIAGRFTVTDGRAKLVTFTHETFPSRSVVVTRRPHRIVTNVVELRAERVGTVKGSSLAEAVNAAGVPPASVDDGIQPGMLPDALKQGKVTAVVLGVEGAIAAHRRDPELQIGLFLGPPRSLAYAVRKEDAELERALDDYIDAFRRSPSWSRLVVKYFGEAAPDVIKKARGEEAPAP